MGSDSTGAQSGAPFQGKSKPKRVPGRPFRKGERDDNPGGMSARAVRRERIDCLEAELAALKKAISARDDGQVTSGRMKRVLGQDRAADVTATDRALREWLERDGKGYFAEVERRVAAESGQAEKEAELECLRVRVVELERQVAESEVESPLLDDLIGRILREAVDG